MLSNPVSPALHGSTAQPFGWGDAIALLQAAQADGLTVHQARRPSHISAEDMRGWGADERIYFESPITRRRKGDDKWNTSGGTKGSVEYWLPDGCTGVCKRFGSIVLRRNDLAKIRFAQYTLLVKDSAGSRTIGDMAVWVVRHPAAGGASQPAAQPANVQLGDNSLIDLDVGAPSMGWGATHFTNPAGVAGQATVDISATHKFISFQSDGPSGSNEAGRELGAIVRQSNGGVKLQSNQGDFAEWYRRAAREAPFEEGDVVGFVRGGVISRTTRGCAMLGVISRRAVVEGSAPPAEQRQHYDTVAHCGVVPVKISSRGKKQRVQSQVLECDCPAPLAGQILTPSGWEDGTAILVPATESVPRVGILLDPNDCLGLSTQSDNASRPQDQLVLALVIAPTDSTRGVSGRSRYATRCAVAAAWLMVAITLLMLTGRHLTSVATPAPRLPLSPLVPQLVPEPEPEPHEKPHNKIFYVYAPEDVKVTCEDASEFEGMSAAGTFCEPYMIGDGVCDQECVNSACPHFILWGPTTDASEHRIADYDGGDCSGCTVACGR